MKDHGTTTERSSVAAEGIEQYDESIAKACERIAPLWPLQNFVAVNPFWGFIDEPFPKVAGRMQRVAHARMHLDRDFYRVAWEEGRITDEDLVEASSKVAGGQFPLNRLRDALLEAPPEPQLLPTLAEYLDQNQGTHYAEAITCEISKWCAGYFDRGQALWTSPAAGQPLFSGWKKMAVIDLNPELRGIKGFRAAVRELQDDPRAVIAEALIELGIPSEGAERFLHRQLLSISGWASFVKQLVREDGLYGRQNEMLVDLLAVRLAYDLALVGHLDTDRLNGWREVAESFSLEDEPLTDESAVWQEAFEIGYRRQLIEKLKRGIADAQPGDESNPTGIDAQAVFCIDVRSERYRRALEATSARIDTVGFAGFFGFPISYHAIDEDSGPSLCPVLLTPALATREAAATGELEPISRFRRATSRVARAWKDFKLSAVSSFSYVESCGIGFGWKLLTDSLGWSRPTDSAVAGMKKGGCTRPSWPTEAEGGPDKKTLAAVSAGALRNMGLTRGFARLVLLCGHGSTTTNNPYGSGLDCGACGGHGGETNARIAAQTLNDPEVRRLLEHEGISIPATTWFLAGRHDTTTDQVELLDLDLAPKSHRDDTASLEKRLHDASHLVRLQRSADLGLDACSERIDQEVIRRAHDWSQVRPEWGLAGNAAFIAAPRNRTATLSLDGRAFLHNYDYQNDPDLGVLELIMTAPMVVANWINMQYFASTVDNHRFGSGTKVTHNVVGTVGVLQGNDGDLQTGLPWQSIHDGEKYVHEPIRLNVIIEAPTHAIQQMIDRHEVVRHLVDNAWLHLLAIEPGTDRYYEYVEGAWKSFSADRVHALD